MTLSSTKPSSMRAQLLSEIYSDPDVHRKIGAAAPLFSYLLHVAEGAYRGTYERLAESLGKSGRAVKDWAVLLEKNGLAVRKQHSRQIEISLTPRYLTIATTSDRMPDEATVPNATMSDLQRKVLALLESASAAGAVVKIKAKMSI